VTTPGLQFLLALVTGWVNRNQQEVIDYLQAENRLLRERLGPRRLRFSDADRRRLAVAAKRIGRKGLFAIDCSTRVTARQRNARLRSLRSSASPQTLPL
jgi:hypothetical protein